LNDVRDALAGEMHQAIAQLKIICQMIRQRFKPWNLRQHHQIVRNGKRRSPRNRGPVHHGDVGFLQLPYRLPRIRFEPRRKALMVHLQTL